MVIGVLIGYYVPGVQPALATVEFWLGIGPNCRGPHRHDVPCAMQASIRTTPTYFSSKSPMVSTWIGFVSQLDCWSNLDDLLGMGYLAGSGRLSYWCDYGWRRTMDCNGVDLEPDC